MTAEERAVVVLPFICSGDWSAERRNAEWRHFQYATEIAYENKKIIVSTVGKYRRHYCSAECLRYTDQYVEIRYIPFRYYETMVKENEDAWRYAVELDEDANWDMGYLDYVTYDSRSDDEAREQHAYHVEWAKSYIIKSSNES